MVNLFDRDHLSDLWWTKSLYSFRVGRMNSLATSLWCCIGFQQHFSIPFDGFRPCTILDSLTSKDTRLPQRPAFLLRAKGWHAEISWWVDATGLVILRCFREAVEQKQVAQQQAERARYLVLKATGVTRWETRWKKWPSFFWLGWSFGIFL